MPLDGLLHLYWSWLQVGGTCTRVHGMAAAHRVLPMRPWEDLGGLMPTHKVTRINL
jgi:hypothetical protein